MTTPSYMLRKDDAVRSLLILSNSIYAIFIASNPDSGFELQFKK